MASLALGHVWRAYLSLLDKKPITTKVATGMVISSIGDLTAQVLLEKKQEVDYLRLAVVTGYGFLGSMIEGHYWLGYLEKVVGPSMGFKASMTKMILDQGIFSPFEVSTFIAWTHILEQRDGSTMDKLKADLPTTMYSSYIFWCPVSLVGFLFVPFHLRVLYGTSMCVLWDTFLSYASHNKIGQMMHHNKNQPVPVVEEQETQDLYPS